MSIFFPRTLKYTLLIIQNRKEMDLISSLILSPENYLLFAICSATVGNLFVASVLPNSLDYRNYRRMIPITELI
jgi:hypothetical protein